MKWPSVTEPRWWYVNIGSGTNFVWSDSKPYTEPMLTQFHVFMASLDHNEVTSYIFSNCVDEKLVLFDYRKTVKNCTACNRLLPINELVVF